MHLVYDANSLGCLTNIEINIVGYDNASNTIKFVAKCMCHGYALKL